MKRLFDNAQQIIEHELEGVSLDELTARITSKQQQRIAERLAEHFIFLLREALLPDVEPQTKPKPIPDDSVGKWLVRSILKGI
jgi:hypothetical protein